MELMGAGDALVLELSSAMLWWLAGGRELNGMRGSPSPLRPEVGVVASFAANHLDWHGGEEHYRRSKQSLLDVLGAGTLAILGPGATDWSTAAGVERMAVAEGARLEAIPTLRIPGPHNLRNAHMALAAAERIWPEVRGEAAVGAASDFAGLPHRLCLVHEVLVEEAPERPVRFYDDSKSTVPEATLLAIDALLPARIHLIAGGYDKGLDLGPIAGRAGGLAGLYTVGATGGGLAAAARSRWPRGSGVRIESCGTLAGAMEVVRRELRPGDAVLLSPGCASWDQFENYEHRGREFARMAREISIEPAHAT